MTEAPVNNSSSEVVIRTRPEPICFLCGRTGKPLHQDLQDRLFYAPGKWTLVQCPGPDCGLAWLDPMPVEEDIGKAYATYYTHPSDDLPARLNLGFRIYLSLRDGYVGRRYGYPSTLWQRLLSPAINLRPGWKAEADFSVLHQPSPRARMSLLDIGCGDGAALLRMRDLGWEVHGIDPDKEAVERARQRGLDVRVGTIEDHPYPASTFDLVTLTHVIEHVHDPVALLTECRRILKPGGKLVVHTPNFQSFGYSIYGDAWRGLEPPRHLHVFSLKSLRQLLERSGQWRTESLRTTVRGAGVIFAASKDIRQRNAAVMGRRWNLLERLKTDAQVVGESVSLPLRPTVGEEILLIAVRKD